MVQNIVNGINTWQDWYKFADKVMKSETFKHSFFVVSQCFNELPCGVTAPDEVCLGKGLTEAEAQRIYDANKYAVENCGTDYAEIEIGNLYDPYGSAAPFVYHRATGENIDRALELRTICEEVHKKFKRMGMYD